LSQRFRPATLVAALMLALSAGAFAAPQASGLDKSGMDPSVRAQDDLFRSVNGGWAKATEIPADKPEFGIFIQLRDLSDERVRTIVEKLAKAKNAPGSANQKVADFYKSYMDTAAIDKAGLAPLKPLFAQVDALKDTAGLIKLMGSLQGVVDLPLMVDTTTDFKNPDTYSPLTWQGGIGLPDRDYLLKDDERFAKARAAYLTYVSTLLTQAGDKDAAAHAADIVALEKQIAEVQWAKVDLRDPVKIYNPMTLAELQAKEPAIDWKAFTQAAGITVPGQISLSQPSFVSGFAKLLGSVPLATWQRYMKVRLMDGASAVLPAAIRDARFEFRGKALQGLTQDRPRWQKAMATLNGALGEALGQGYVAQYFPPAYKARMVELVNNLMKAYGSSIDGLSWMSPATKAAAHDKLSKYMVKIGYPDTWRDYGKLVVKAGDPLGNEIRASRFEFQRQAARIGKKVDRAEWGMTPQTVNAYYNPSLNEIVFPAAILQPPFFDMQADDAVNYGAIGAVIGHEISHGFDDEGSKFDGDGKLRDWWTAEDRKAFDEITAKLVAQYDAYEPLPGKHLNGKLTLGENIADLSGLQIAYKAWKLSLGGKPAPVIDGLSGEQRFFMGWAQAWRDKTRDERALQLLTTDPHSPAQFRANGAAVNHDGFHEAFGTKPGDAMYKAPADRLRLW